MKIRYNLTVHKEDRQIFLNTFYQVAGKIVISLLGFFTTALLARYLGLLAFGQYNLILSFVSFVSIVADFGLGSLIIRETARRDNENGSLAGFFTLRIFLSLISLLVITLSTVFLPYSALIKFGIIIASIGGVLYMLSALFWSVFQGRLQFGKVVIIQLICSVLTFLLILLCVLWHAGLLFFILISVLVNSIGFYVSYVQIGRLKLIDFDCKQLRRLFFQSLPFGAAAIFSVAYFKIDTIILSVYHNPAVSPDVGIYSLSYRIMEVMLVFSGYFAQSLFPVFSRYIFTPQFSKLFQKYFWLTAILAVAFGVGSYVFAPLLVSLLGGGKYILAVPSVQILSLAVIVSILNGFFTSIAIAGNKQVLVSISAFLTLLFNVILNLIYLPRFSYLGASWTTVATQAFILLCNILISTIVIKNLHQKTYAS